MSKAEEPKPLRDRLTVNPDKGSEDRFLPGSMWVNRLARGQGFGDAARWVVVKKTEDGIVLRNKATEIEITKTEAELNHSPKRVAPMIPTPQETVGRETVGVWEYAGKDTEE